MSTKTARALLVWFHVLTSVGWMSLALCMFTLLGWARSAVDEGERLAAYRMAEVLDVELLQHLGVASAFSGIMLAALTPWGFFRYWWVLGKFAITLIQLYAGIFLLSKNMQSAAAVPGSLLMASAMAFQAWLSIAKPWKHPRWVRLPLRKLPTGPAWLFLLGIAIPVLDYAIWQAPILSLLTALVYPFVRKRRLAQLQRQRVIAVQG